MLISGARQLVGAAREGVVVSAGEVVGICGEKEAERLSVYRSMLIWPVCKLHHSFPPLSPSLVRCTHCRERDVHLPHDNLLLLRARPPAPHRTAPAKR